MEHTLYISPFPHIDIKNILTDEENEFLTNVSNSIVKKYKEQIDSYEFFLLEEDKKILNEKSIEWCIKEELIQNSTSLIKYFDFKQKEKWELIQESISKRLFEIIENHENEFPLQKKRSNTKKDKKFNVGYILTADNDDVKPLFPHTDYRFHILEDMGYGKFEHEDSDETKTLDICGDYKGLIYVGDLDLDYSEYGTRIYENQDRSSEVKEIKFIPKNGLLFKTTANSYHGTNFKNGYKNYRYSIIFEYY